MTYKKVSRQSVTKHVDVPDMYDDTELRDTSSFDGTQHEPKGPTGRHYDLPTRLELATKLSIREMIKVLRVPMDPKDGNLLRAKLNAAGITLNAQLRADEARLKAKVHTDTLARLLKIVEQQKMQLLDDTK